MNVKFDSQALVPRYVTQFRCLGGECVDTCCAGWDVAADQYSLDRFRSLANTSLRQKLEQALIVEGDKAFLCRGGSGQACPMFSGKGLCAIHSELGDDALFDVCHTYPRYSFKFGDRFEQSLGLSCPEAARLALAADNALEFVGTDLNFRSALVKLVTPVAGFTLEAMDDVRTQAIRLCRSVGLDVRERLVALGLLCSRLDELAAESRQEEVGDSLSWLTSLLESGQLKAFVMSIERQPLLSASIFVMLIGNAEDKGKSAEQREVLGWMRDGLGVGRSVMPTPGVLSDSLPRALAAMAPVSTLQEDVLTRFLLNEVFRCVFPWGQGAPLTKSFRHMLLLVGGLRLAQLAAAAALAAPLDRTQMIRVTQVFCRIFADSTSFAERADRLLVGAGYDSPEKLFPLI